MSHLSPTSDNHARAYVAGILERLRNHGAAHEI